MRTGVWSPPPLHLGRASVCLYALVHLFKAFFNFFLRRAPQKFLYLACTSNNLKPYSCQQQTCDKATNRANPHPTLYPRLVYQSCHNMGEVTNLPRDVVPIKYQASEHCKQLKVTIADEGLVSSLDYKCDWDGPNDPNFRRTLCGLCVEGDGLYKPGIEKWQCDPPPPRKQLAPKL
ncbi:hypothetical protein O181_069926 [Austropuccinia psidii MF-1]|uniref:Uncharacterized protein n=1 Tax=Austropuccinia psidii MF-1 TaxID=1389203 RepID=A0A9Q3F4E7_9BASI|nr:hypothetical protein [Austropuccinia psidii MF-1]